MRLELLQGGMSELELRHQRRFIRSRIREGKHVPDDALFLVQTPWVSKILAGYWQGFLLLNCHRSFHMAGPNPISTEAIIAYRKEFIPKRDREKFFFAVHAMDAIYLDDCYKKDNNRRNDPPAKG